MLSRIIDPQLYMQANLSKMSFMNDNKDGIDDEYETFMN